MSGKKTVDNLKNVFKIHLETHEFSTRSSPDFETTDRKTNSILTKGEREIDFNTSGHLQLKI